MRAAKGGRNLTRIARSMPTEALMDNCVQTRQLEQANFSKIPQDQEQSKSPSQLPDFRHNQSNVPRVSENRNKSGFAQSQLATVDVVLKTTVDPGSTAAQKPKALGRNEFHSDIGVCSKLCEDGVIWDAVDALKLLVQRGCHVPSSLFYRMLRRCIQDKNLTLGKRIHALTVESGYAGNAFLATHLIALYASHFRLEEATAVFTEVLAPSIYNWTTIIFAYARQGEAAEAIRLYRQMCKSSTLKPDDRLFSAVIEACTAAKDLATGREVHAHVLATSGEPDKFVQAGLVNMYAKCGCLDDARRLFNKLPDGNVVAWTAMIAAYAQQGMGQEALSLYNSMQQKGLISDAVTYVCLLQACASVGVRGLHLGKQLHAQIVGRRLGEDGVLGVSLVDMYAKCGSLEDARRLFDNLTDRNVVAFTAMIAGYAQQGLGQEALRLFRNMQQKGLTPNSVTYVCLLQGCASMGIGALHEGKQLHAKIVAQDLGLDAVLGGSLVNMYVKCGSIEDARRVFNELLDRNVVAWTAMIAGYAQQGMGQEALNLHSSMRREGLTPDSVTYVCLLQACAVVAALHVGEQLHAEIEERGIQADGLVGTALVNMYAKCGSMYDSQLVFDSLSGRTVEAWGALINGYAHQGDSQIVFDLLHRMTSDGIHPDEITFLSVLTACSHVGLVDKGREYFQSMRADYAINATIEHYVCMVDLLGRAGHLQDALQMARTMPFPPNYVVWLTLLGACHKWKNVEIGQQAFEGAIRADDKDGAPYVLMSNIYVSSQMWEAAKAMKARRMKLGAWKKPGQSWWTDMEGVVHTFHVGDTKHAESENIYGRMQQLIAKIIKEGYVPLLESSLQGVPDDKKQVEMCAHSERLAIAYALNKTAEGTTIRIAKNLRVCEDCHVAIGYISKVEKRTIISRDAARFHVYIDGVCSCGGYW